MPDADAWLAVDDVDDEKTSRDAADVMNAAECWSLCQRFLLSKPSSLDNHWFATDAIFASLLSRGIKGQGEGVARWLLDPKNRFSDLQQRKAQEQASGAIMEWSREDARAAADFAATLTLTPPDADDEFSLPRVLTNICSAWGRDDPHGALAWAKGLPDADRHKVYALEGVFQPFNEFQPDDARACAERLVGVNKAAPEFAGMIAGRLTQMEMRPGVIPQNALWWAQFLPGQPERRKALAEVVGVWVPWSADSLTQAVRWATPLPPSDTRATAWAEVAKNWSAIDGLTRGSTAGSPEFFDNMKINGEAADTWLHRLPPGADRDEAIAARAQWEKSLREQKIWR